MRQCLSIRRRGFTMTELLLVVTLIGILAGLAIPSLHAVKRRNFESQCVAKMAELGLLEIRHYAAQRTFGDFDDLQAAGLIPRGYMKQGFFAPVATGRSVRPYIEMYSLRFVVPRSGSSLFFKIDAYPAREGMGLRTFNISMILDNAASKDTLFTAPPVREGISIYDPPVGSY